MEGSKEKKRPAVVRQESEPTRIAVLSIIVENTDRTGELNSLIHGYAPYIVGRMGIPYHKKKVNIISLVMDAPQTAISELSGKIGRIEGISAKVAYSKK